MRPKARPMSNDPAKGAIIKVLIGEAHCAQAPHVLQAVVGSCIAVGMFDPVKGIAGMAHVLLPYASDRDESVLPAKFADKAIPCLRSSLLELGADARRLKAKIAGGAQMFRDAQSCRGSDIGAINACAVRDMLAKYGIGLLGHVTGGFEGRKVELRLDTYGMRVECFGGESLEI